MTVDATAVPSIPKVVELASLPKIKKGQEKEECKEKGGLTKRKERGKKETEGNLGCGCYSGSIYTQGSLSWRRCLR